MPITSPRESHDNRDYPLSAGPLFQIKNPNRGSDSPYQKKGEKKDSQLRHHPCCVIYCILIHTLFIVQYFAIVHQDTNERRRLPPADRRPLPTNCTLQTSRFYFESAWAATKPA